jgi:multisubunit Na+/H+ antiporter MnhB subunit
MPESSAAPGDRLIRAGLVVTAVGMLLTLVAMIPLVTDVELPSALWWLSMLVGVGLAMVLIGLARNGRRRSRAQTAARATLD